MSALPNQILTDLVTNSTSNEKDNKAALIRKAFQVMSAEAKINDIVDHLKREYNVEVSAAYVSNVKQQFMRALNSQTFEALRLARKLVREVGGIPQARKTLEALAEEQERVAMTRNHYGSQLEEINVRLNDEEHPLEAKDRRELIREKQRIEKLLDALEDF